MKAIRIFLVAALAAALTLPATGSAQGETENVEIVLETHGEGGKFWFTKAGETEKNPALQVPPGAEVTLRIVNKDGNYHNIATSIPGTPTSDATDAVDETAEITFTAPTEPGSFEYWCVPHKGMDMKGVLVVGEPGSGDAAPAGEPAPESTKGSPGLGAVAVLGVIALAGVLGRRQA